ncbi:D-hexose-6-phosphate mutarotase [uncultured Paraglaciecola sp.]|uniref:D-hexose-6-phosphate mutarotase n=1 Tax=uncultured Paraglaciecola sp. TaxID=1765024 RepID=UPI0030D71696|tara:strand:- start:43693 stop:44532 length:840 start_codon:yes stop_codon:yes gene_type:complete
MLLTESTKIVTKENIQLIQIENDFATAEVALFGGHIISFKPKHDNRERLWVSKEAIFDGKKALRGGIPICWPWFGPHATQPNLAAHGYVRTQIWTILSTEETELGTHISLQPQSSIDEGLDGKAQLTLTVVVGQELKIQLHTTNIGNTPLTYNCALHSYFAISDIKQCELLGLSEQYSDKTRDFQLFETPHPYKFNEETDRVHLQQPKRLSIIDKQIKTDILSSGHDSIVVWNPWQDKCISMDDMASNSYLTMLCVETAVTQNQVVNAGDTHILEQIII